MLESIFSEILVCLPRATAVADKAWWCGRSTRAGEWRASAIASSWARLSCPSDRPQNPGFFEKSGFSLESIC